MIEDRVLTGIFGTKREAMPGGWREMQNEGLLERYYYL